MFDENDDLNDLTIEEINKLYANIIELPTDSYIAGCYVDGSNRCGKGNDVRHGAC